MKLFKNINNIFKITETIHQKNIFNYLKKIKLDSIIDIGAHTGDFSGKFINNKKIKNFYLFEPQLKFYKYLLNKFKNNKKIKIYNIAIDTVNNKIKKIALNIDPSTSSLAKIDKNSLLYKIKNLILDSKDNYYSSQKVKTLRIDYFLKKKKINRISLLKIDTEGYEMKIIKSIGSYIKKIKYILLELKFIHFYKNYSRKKISEYLLKNNFILVKNFRHPMMHYQDSLYINKKYYDK
jgi:FkbM family methyltransferase